MTVLTLPLRCLQTVFWNRSDKTLAKLPEMRDAAGLLEDHGLSAPRAGGSTGVLLPQSANHDGVRLQRNRAEIRAAPMFEVAEEAAPQQAEEESPSTAQETGRPARQDTKRLPRAAARVGA